MKQFHTVHKFSPEKCPIYLCLPWLSCVSTWFEKQVKPAVKQCISTVEPHIVYSANKFLFSTNKDVVPGLQKSNLIYQFTCHCDNRYVGRTFPRPQDRIKQHVTKSICLSPSHKRLLSASQCKSSTQTNTYSLNSDFAMDFSFYKILSELNIKLHSHRRLLAGESAFCLFSFSNQKKIRAIEKKRQNADYHS